MRADDTPGSGSPLRGWAEAFARGGRIRETGAVQFAERRVFTVERTGYAWADVLLAGWRWGEWEPFERGLVQGLACRRRQIETGEPPPAAEVEAATTAFRYARGLIAGSDAAAWLERRGLTVAAWQEHFRRTALRERWRRELDEIGRAHV